MFQITISKRAAVIIAIALVLLIPGVAGATHIFSDVSDSNVHAPGIEWVAGVGVTAGCGDGSTYCPGDPVTRAQMGTFMHRLSGNASGIAPSVNAGQLDGLDSTDFLRGLYGRGPSSADQALLFEWPDTGVEVRTHSIAAGDAVFEVRIVNTNPPGGSSFSVSNLISPSALALAPGASVKVGGLTGASVLLTENKGSLGRMMHLNCFANVISGGDDGFIQCMGITAGAP